MKGKQLRFFLVCLISLSFVSHSNATASKEKYMINREQLLPEAKKDMAWFEQRIKDSQLMEKLKDIKLIILDVDGALTDGQIYLSSQGEDGRFFSIQDGYIFQFLHKAGIKLTIISGKAHNSALIRAKKLGIDESLVLTGVTDKVVRAKQLLDELGVQKEQTLMWGDDHLDMQLKEADAVGLLAMPANAPFYFQAVTDLLVPRNGGDEHAFRLLADLLLYAKQAHPCQNLIEQVLE